MILGDSLKHKFPIGDAIMTGDVPIYVSGILYSFIRSSVMSFIGQRIQIEIGEV